MSTTKSAASTASTASDTFTIFGIPTGAPNSITEAAIGGTVDGLAAGGARIVAEAILAEMLPEFVWFKLRDYPNAYTVVFLMLCMALISMGLLPHQLEFARHIILHGFRGAVTVAIASNASSIGRGAKKAEQALADAGMKKAG